MNYDRPERYDLCDPNSDSTGPTAVMAEHRQGDWVKYGDYETLLEAYDEAVGKLSDIARIAG